MITNDACNACKHFTRWDPASGMRHPQYGSCANPERWGEGGIGLARDDDTCDAFQEPNHAAA